MSGSGLVWLGGSLARGDADQSSDLDVIIAVADESFEDFAGGWRPWLDAITPTVIARELPFLRGSFYSVTPSMERLDVITEAVSALANTLHRVRLLVLDKDGCDARIAPIAAVRPVAAGHSDARRGVLSRLTRCSTRWPAERIGSLVSRPSISYEACCTACTSRPTRPFR